MWTMKKKILYLQVGKEFTVRADHKNKKSESYRMHCYQIKAKMRLTFKQNRSFFFSCKTDYKLCSIKLTKLLLHIYINFVPENSLI